MKFFLLFTVLFLFFGLSFAFSQDLIILIDGNVIAESGTHEELLSAGKKYAELFEIQSKYYLEEVVMDVVR